MGLVSPSWLAGHLGAPDLRICDVRWYLPTSGKSGRAAYDAGHLPGAVFVDLDTDLSSPDDGRAGRHPLPEPAAFERAMKRHGISANTHVIAYDDAGGAVATRLWWLLRAHGHTQVSILDGGLAGWMKAGGALEQQVPSIAPGSFVSRWDPSGAISLEETRALVAGGAVLLDARAGERYRGETEPVDPRAGHIPGAVNVPLATLLEDGRLLAPDRLEARLASLGLGARPVVASCGSGVNACLLLFALDHARIAPFPAARLFVGSYSEWSRRPDLPVATGADPGEPV